VCTDHKITVEDQSKTYKKHESITYVERGIEKDPRIQIFREIMFPK
jgi:hypothetical protein